MHKNTSNMTFVECAGARGPEGLKMTGIRCGFLLSTSDSVSVFRVNNAQGEKR